jgi:hypothetical protein
MATVQKYLREKDGIADPRIAYRRHECVFETLLNSVGKMGSYLAEQKRGKEAYFTAEGQCYLGFTEVLITHIFGLALSPRLRSAPRVWDRMRSFCAHWDEMQMLLLIWQKAVVDATGTLSDSLAAIPSAEYTVLANSQLTPFEGLPMKREYALQVLYNARAAQSKGEIENGVYRDVYRTKIYESFDVWFNLLQLVQIRPEFKSKQTLSEYARSKTNP